MNLAKLTTQLAKINGHPPVEKWNPPFCGDMDIQIKADGTWCYMGTPIGRMPLVKLFASVLTYQQDQYFLVTPVEKVRIQVADAPFIISQWRYKETESGKAIIFTSNTDDEFILSQQYCTALPTSAQSGPLYLNIHRTMQACFHRNVYYQLAEIASIKMIDDKPCWVVQSAGNDYVLGIDE
jgi:hypothetical protein